MSPADTALHSSECLELSAGSRKARDGDGALHQMHFPNSPHLKWGPYSKQPRGDPWLQ